VGKKMDNTDHGHLYFIVEVTRDISSDGWISFMANDVSVSPNGDLITLNHGRGIKYPGLILPRGKWLYCHAASMIDGRAITVDHWNTDDENKQDKKKINKSIRYDILKRDNFTCVICGRSQRDGVILHVDHITPVSRGGITTKENLRTLCSDCNLGKSNKIEDRA